MQLTTDQLRRNLRDAADASGLSYSQIGLHMGLSDAESAKNAVNYLLNRSADPGILTVLSFCEAVGQEIKNVLKTD